MTSMPGRRAVGRGRRRGVAGRGADDGPRARPRPPWRPRRPCPRSLNEPVGFWPSILRCRFGTPIAAPSRGAWTSGVTPSPRVSGGRRVGDGQERAVALDRAAAGRPAPPGEVSHRSGTGCRSRSRGRPRAGRATASPVGAGRRRPRPPGRARAAGDRDEVAEHGRRRRRATRARARRTRPGRPASASISIRLRTPAVRPSGESSGSAVGRTAARQAAVRARASPWRAAG